MGINFDNVSPLFSAAQAFLDAPKKMLIGGEWVAAQSGKTFDTIDPGTGKVLAALPQGGAQDIDMAVSAARKALSSDGWAGMTPAERGRLLWKMGDLIDENIDELSQLETLDQGKPFHVGRWAEIPGGAEQFRYYGGEANKVEGKTIPTSINYQPEGKKIFAYTQKQPVGVVGAIVPWNSPIVLTAMKLAPALAAGCTIILKPAEDTSLTALRLGELFIEAGFPSGVVNVVTGYGREAGAALAAHMDVDKIVFTGSTATGRSIVDAAKGNLKKVTLELGGKSPVIIMDDANLDLAIPGAANGIFFNGGQVCVAGSRLYAHHKVYDKVIAGLVEAAKALKMGHGLDPNVQMGPLVNSRQAKQVQSFIERAEKAGAKIEVGGNSVDGAACFVEPTVISNVTSDMEIVQEEVFGPVIVCTPIDSLEEVTELANDSIYGLAASVWTENLSTAHRLAADIKAGTIWINCHLMFDASLPIGGVKQSGYGRDSGRQAIENYLETKTVCAVI